MFHIKDNIAASLAIIVMFTVATGFARNANPAQFTPPSKKALKKQVAAPVKLNDPASPDFIFEASGDDSAEAVKLRSDIGNPIAGKSKSELCQGCHGEDGNSPDSMIPNLAGQYAKYIAKQLRNFQAGVRTHQIMSAIAASISDDDLADIAAYFASRTKMKGDGSEGNPTGKNLFLNGDMTRMMVGCIECHGMNGKGKTPKNPVFPVIGGQHKDYLRGHLINFRGGDRTNSPGGVMNIIAQKMTDSEIEALADYISRL